MGKGTIIQAGKSPMGMAVQISGNQKNKLNDPGGGSFRYILPGEGLPFPVCITWGQHFSKMPYTTTGYTHSKGCECLSQLPAWPPGCLPVRMLLVLLVMAPTLSLTHSLCLSLHPPHSNTHPANRSSSPLRPTPPPPTYQCHNSLKRLQMS